MHDDDPAAVCDYKPYSADHDALFPLGFHHGYATASAQIEGHIHTEPATGS